MTEQQLQQMRKDVDALASYADAATERLIGLEKAGTEAMAQANAMFAHILLRIDELKAQMDGLKRRLDTIVPGG